MEIDRTLSFKGARTYLHSTTVLDDLLQLKGDGLRAVDFTFDKRTDHQVRYQNRPPEDDQVLVATWRDQSGTTWIVERDATIIDSRPYDEDALAARFAFDDRSVRLPERVDGHSLVEAMVAGFKALLQRSVAGNDAKLAFVRLRLPQIPALPLEIRYSRRIGEFYQGDILAGGKPAGQIFFGEWT